MPVLLPGCMLEIPPEPMMENDVRDGRASHRAARVRSGTGVRNHEDVTSRRQNDYTQVDYDRRETVFELAGLQIEMELPKRVHFYDLRMLAANSPGSNLEVATVKSGLISPTLITPYILIHPQRC